jgi:hypothetical protein
MSLPPSLISVSAALKRLRSSDYELYDAASRRVAWDSVMAAGSTKDLRLANEARDCFGFNASPAQDAKVSQ